MNPIRVCFFGDSICVGQNVSIHAGWVPGVSARLSQLAEERNRQIIVTNASANGRTTREALVRMPYELQTQEPGVVIVQFGMNDCNYWQSDRGVPRVSPDSFAANLCEIVSRARNFGARAVILNTNHPTGLDQEKLPFTAITYQESNARYNEIIRGVATQLGDDVILNDIEGVFAQHTGGQRERLSDLILPEPDLLHLSEAGHRLYLDVTLPLVESIVGDLIEPDAR